MALSIQLGFPDVPSSITNPNVQIQNALDVGNPMSFLTFIKTIIVSFEPDSLQNYYNFYLNTWNNKNNLKTTDNNNLIIERYRDFIKELSINHTTPEEKRFLSKIDFNDPYDLDIVLGFYGKKLKELSTYYNNKRQDVKFDVVRNKLKGTNYGTSKKLIELTLSYLKNLDDGRMLYDYDSIKEKIEVEIEELYDSYPLYYDQVPNSSIYDKKDLDYGYDIFLKSNSELIPIIFSGLSDELQNLKEVEDILDNKRKLTQKYVSTDFYYLSTGNTTTNYVSGLLFENDNAVSNFVNRHYPTTASSEQSEYYKSSRDTGFFKPSKQSIILIDGKNSSFSVNLSNLEPNSLYYFPDPTFHGKNGDILTFIVDDSYLKRNFSSGVAQNQPTSEKFNTNYYGYVSKYDPTPWKYLNNIFDSGFIKDSKYDIFNNLFGLFKNDHRFRQTIKNIDTAIVTNLLVNGYKFYDDLYNEGLSFNYLTEDSITYNETIRSGITAWGGGFLTNNNPELTLFFGYFNPYNELILPTEDNLIETTEIIEGGFISKEDFSPYDDAISSDLSAFETSTGSFYYTDLIDGGIYSINPLTRGLFDPLYPSISSSLTVSPRSSAIDVVDGGFTNVLYDFDLSFSSNNLESIPTTINPSVYNIDVYPYDENYELNGKILVKNSQTKEVKPLFDTFDYLINHFPETIIDQLSSNVINFEISNDVFILESLNYLTINKILFDNGEFKDPKITPITITHSTNEFNKLSNRYKVGNKIYYCVLNTTSLTSNNFSIYPEIYQFDLINFKHEKIFSNASSTWPNYIELFNINGGEVRYIHSDNPVLTYNSRNNIFNVSFLIKDQNNYPKLCKYDFILTPDVEFNTFNDILFSNTSNSNIFDTLSTISIFLSSNQPVTQSEELIF